DNAVALGSYSFADRPNSVSVGTPARTHHGVIPVEVEAIDRQITHVAAGTEATDAVNLSQLERATAHSRYFEATGDADNDQPATVDGEFATAAGSGAYAGELGASA